MKTLSSSSAGPKFPFADTPFHMVKLFYSGGQMGSFSEGFLSVADLYLAYRKAKADAFFENTHFRALGYAEYERNLDRNLRRLYAQITDVNSQWTKNRQRIAGYFYAPKSVGSFDSNDDVHYAALDPVDEWKRKFTQARSKHARADFRLMIAPTVDMQVFSALWILKVGFRYEMKLDRQHSYGNRLRGRRHSHLNGRGDNQSINEDCTGLFVPYFSAYRTWRERGLKAMRKSLEKGQRIVALTMDLSRFYHQVSPKFILRKAFLERLNLVLDKDEKRLTMDLVDAITTWYESTPDFQQRPQGALPVGLSASKVIANMVMYEFDNAAKEKLDPV